MCMCIYICIYCCQKDRRKRQQQWATNHIKHFVNLSPLIFSLLIYLLSCFIMPTPPIFSPPSVIANLSTHTFALSEALLCVTIFRYLIKIFYYISSYLLFFLRLLLLLLPKIHMYVCCLKTHFLFDSDVGLTVFTICFPYLSRSASSIFILLFVPNWHLNHRDTMSTKCQSLKAVKAENSSYASTLCARKYIHMYASFEIFQIIWYFKYWGHVRHRIILCLLCTVLPTF